MSATENIQKIRAELKALFIERDELVDAALIAVLSRQHLLMLGPPGTAKSMLAREVCRRIAQKRYFEWLLTKFTTPEEIFGPVSLPALEAGRYERVTSGKLPEAEIVFLDEIFKASSAILNALLTVLNERRYHQGTQVIEVPLESMFAASNELPEEDELGALYDRLLLRFTVAYVESDLGFERLLRLGASPPSAVTMIGAAELAELQARAAAVRVPDGVLRDLVEVRKRLGAEGVVASDRRYRASIDVLRASALLSGRDEVALTDLRWLEHVLWSDPEDRPKIRAVLAELATGMEEEASRLARQAREIDGYARKAWPDRGAQNRALLEAHTKLEDLQRRIAQMAVQGRARGRDASGIDRHHQEVLELQRRLLESLS